MRFRSPLAAIGAFVLIALLLHIRGGFAADELRIEVDGQATQFEAPPVVRDGVVCVPMVGVFTRLGAVCNYDKVTRTVKALRGTTVILITLGKDTAMVGIKPYKLQVPAFTQEAHVMVPLRFVSEAMGAHVAWDEDKRLVSIRAPKEMTPVTLPSVTVGTPAPSESPSPTATGVAITESRHSATGTLHPGDVLTVTLVGTPKGQASFSIPGASDKVALKETDTAGTYAVEYKIPAGVSVKAAPVYGVLLVGTQRAPLATAATLVTILPLVPHVEKPMPAPGSTVAEKTPRITGFFEMVGGTLDPATVRVTVNGADVTKQAYVNREFFTYTPPQPLSGRVKVEVSGRTTPNPLEGASMRDWSDNWSFEIQGAAAKIGSATHGPTAIYKPDDVLEVTMIGTAGGAATFDIGTYKTRIPMRETAPGTYLGSYRVQRSDRVAAAGVVVHLKVGADDLVAQVPIPVTLGVGVAGEGEMPLTVTAPRPGNAIDKSFGVRGQTVPGALVRVDVMGRVPLVERDVRVAGGEATADAQGTFNVNVQLPLMVGGVKLLLVITASDGSGKSAGPVQVPVTGKQ